MNVTPILLAVWAVVASQREVSFYGGDGIQDNGIACERNTQIADARLYDDFDFPAETTISGVWGNFLTSSSVPRSAHYEVRREVSQGNGGILLAGGDVQVSVLYTGRSGFGLTEYQIRGNVPPLMLSAGKYWLTVAPIGYGYGRHFASFTRGTDEGPPSDPNPPVTGGPIHNRNMFFDSATYGYNFEPVENITSSDVDASFGVGVPTTIARSLSLADSFAITRGTLGGGGIYEMWGLDDKRLTVQQRFPFNASSPSAQIQADTSSPVPHNPAGNRITLTIESRCTGAPSNNVIERIEMFDFTQQLWIVVSERAASNTDRHTVITRTGGYVEPGTNRLLCRIGWYDRGVVNLNWSGQVDWSLWDISP